MRNPREFELVNGLIVGVEERSELCGCPEIRDWVERLQGRREGVRERPHRTGSELLVAGSEVIPMDFPDQMPGNIEIVFDERPVDDQLRLLIGDLAGTPGLDLLAKRIKRPLDAVDSD